VLVKPDDEAALAAAMIDMIDNPDDRARRAAAAREVADRHSVRANAAGLARMYRSLAQAAPVGAATAGGRS